jgi:hypothetical protein
VIGSFAYRSDYDAVLAEEKLLQRNAAEKNCGLLVSAAERSDHPMILAVSPVRREYPRKREFPCPVA